MKSLVVFHGFGSTFLARLFGCDGFRHCFVCVAHNGYWLSLDYRAGMPELDVVCADSFDLAEFYRNQGFSVVEIAAKEHALAWPWMVASCVGAVKKIIGIGAPWILTPHQLYYHLNQRNT